jgi:hypothetical protein
MGWRLGEEEVDVFGHDYVAEEVELVFFAHGFERVFEDRSGVGRREIWIAVVTTECDEVEVACLLSSF